MPGDFEYSNDYTTGITNAGGTPDFSPMHIKHAILQLGTLIGSYAGVSATATTPTLGAAAQLANKTVTQTIYIDVTTGGQLTLAIGPTSGVANTLFSGTSPVQMMTVRLPPAWYIAVTTSGAAVWSAVAITG